MIIDCHNHLGKDLDGEEQNITELISNMDKQKITHSVVFPFNTSNEELITQSCNLLKESKKNKKLIPLLRFNPEFMKELELKKLLSKGFAGVKIHPEANKIYPNSKKYDLLYDLISKNEIPILFHCKEASNFSKPKYILEIAKKHPKLIIILGHFFGDNLSIIDEIKKTPNVYTETSINSRTLRIKQIMEDGYKNIMLGSDSPYDDCEVALLKIKKSKLNLEDKNIILFENAKKIFSKWFNNTNY